MSQQQQQQQHHHHDPKPVSVATTKQRRANRRNARQSTGPRSDAGRRAAGRNAITHGLFCRDAVMPGESMLEFRAFRALLFASRALMPQDYLELSLAEQYVLARWKLRRIGAAEIVIHEVAVQGMEDVNRLVEPADYDRFMYSDLQEVKDAEAVADEDAADEEDPAAAAARQQARENSRRLFAAMAERGEVPAATTLALSMTANNNGGRDGGYERMSRYQQRLEQSASRALRELRQVRKDKGVEVSALTHCPFLEAVGDNPNDLAELDELLAQRAAREREAQGQPEVEDRAQAEDEDERPPDSADSADLADSGDQPTSAGTPREPQPAPAQKKQNEANSPATVAASDAQAGCEQSTRKIEIITPTKLAPPGAAAPRDAGRSAAD